MKPSRINAKKTTSIDIKCHCWKQNIKRKTKGEREKGTVTKGSCGELSSSKEMETGRKWYFFSSTEKKIFSLDFYGQIKRPLQKQA